MNNEENTTTTSIEEDDPTETSVFVCHPNPEPECLDGEAPTTTVVYEELDQTETADIIATSSEPVPFTPAPTLPVTGFEGSLSILGASLVAVGLAALRTSRTKK